LLEHIFGVFGGAADTAGGIVDGRLEGSEELLQGGLFPRPGPGDHRLGVGEGGRFPHISPCPGVPKNTGGLEMVAWAGPGGRWASKPCSRRGRRARRLPLTAQRLIYPRMPETTVSPSPSAAPHIWLHHLEDEADAAFLYRELAQAERDTPKADLYRKLAQV